MPDENTEVETEAGQGSVATGSAPETPAPESKEAVPETNGDDPETPPTGEAPAGAGEPLTVDNLTIPEGMELDEGLSTSFLEILNNGDLSTQERADKFTALYGEASQKILTSIEEQAVKTIQDWGQEVISDKELGGDNLPETQSKIRDVLDEFGSPELESYIDSTGIGNRKEFIQFLVNIAPLISEGKPAVGDPTSGEAAQTPARKLYPNQGKT